MNLFGNGNILSQDGETQFFPNAFSKSDADRLFHTLAEKINWRHEPIKMFGRELMQPRLTAYYAHAGKDYTYSGITMKGNAWISELLEIKEHVEKLCLVKFNAALLNYYRDGKDSMAWHSDNEKELGRNPIIASVSFGSSRNFQFRHLYHKQLKAAVLLTHGSLLLMQGPTQHFWQHQIPKTNLLIGPRINITFRVIN